jgi:hypothetical protein
MDNHALLNAPATGSRQQSCDQAGQHLAAIAARLTARGITSRLTRLGGTPVLTIDQPGPGPYPVTVTVDPDPGTGSGLPVDCTCLWTPAPGTTPEATADTIITVLNALRPATTPVSEGE